MEVVALLGPTNTGKTHRALERMLEHQSGAIGVPLRLLAREVYEKLTARVGEGRVALVTGEEKRVPRSPKYWVCTVEAMPSDLDVDFVAIDEVQLAADDQRGHVFTDRILRARGRRETWLLGAETIRPVIEKLVPEAQMMRLPRLSNLSFAGASSLGKLPPRSAVVTFSTEKVFELAERIRLRKGGAAVVLGVLSPRARNAQVAMFQSGEVDHLVATDAIGMGLNLDLAHVAFAALRKFDGREARDLEKTEIAQIAGRAGRHTRDGTFGTLAPLELPRDLARSVENHRFDPIARVRWRSAALDFSSTDALVASLKVRPQHEVLRLDDEAEDLAALVALSAMPDVRARATSTPSIQLLWDVCRIPDYRKLLFESHMGLLAMLYVQLVDHGRIDEELVSRRIAETAALDGGIETLTARLAAIRTWSYVANQGTWGVTAFQPRTREVEDALSDALHAALVARFVARAQKRSAREKAIDPAHPFASLAALRTEAIVPTVEPLIDAQHEEFSVDARGGIQFDGRTVAQLVRGATMLTPDVRLLEDDLAPGARVRVLRRLVAFARDWVEELLAPLHAFRDRGGGGARGLAYMLEKSLGTARSRDVRAQLEALDEAERALLGELGVYVGVRSTFVIELMTEDALARRALLASLFEPRNALARGCLVYRGRELRCDRVEWAFSALVSDDPPDERTIAEQLGVPQRDVARIARAIVEER
ncbi:MAG: helicase-related protein [Polyangiales bacterium]